MTYSENHWANESTTRQYIMHILLPYLLEKRKELKLIPTYPALVLFDNFKGQWFFHPFINLPHYNYMGG